MSRIWPLFLLLCACGSGEEPAPATFTTTDTELSDVNSLQKRSEFEAAVVGHRLRGDGVDVTVAQDGLMVGTQLGEPFTGRWTFRDRKFCYSMTGHPWIAKDRKCFRTAIIGRTVHLVPIED